MFSNFKGYVQPTEKRNSQIYKVASDPKILNLQNLNLSIKTESSIGSYVKRQLKQ